MKKTHTALPNQRLKTERELRGWSQKDVAEQLGADHYYVSRWERGAASPSPYYRQKLCALFGKNAQELGLLGQVANELVTVSTSEPSTELPKPPQTMSDVPRHEPLWKMPTPLTSFVGREHLIQTLCTMLLRPDRRFLTLLGTGGIGKTRAAIQVANEVRHAFADGVCFVSLAQIRDPDLVISAIARALGLQEQPERSTFELLSAWLREKQLLLLLDNFEQVLAAAPRIEDLYARCPWLKVLVTSRAVLHVQGEQEFSVPPLALPDLHTRSKEQWAPTPSAAVTLFVQRAQTTLPTFQLTPTNTEVIEQICVRLDGLPLALELAAARIKLLPPQALLARLSQRLQALEQGVSTLPERQRTLRNTLKWSYDLLEASEQRVFRRLCIFVGGCNLSAVEAVCLDAGEPETAVLNTVASLMDKSLLRQEEQEGGEPRLALLETVREYGLECLREGGETGAISRAHALHYLALAERVEPHLRGGGEQLKWLTVLNREQENFRAALLWLTTSEETEYALRLCGALWWYWFMQTHYKEAHHWLETALARPQTRSPARAQVLVAAGVMKIALGHPEQALAIIEQSIALYEDLEDRSGAAHARQFLAWVYLEQGDCASARTLVEASLHYCRLRGDTWQVGLGLNDLAKILWLQGDETAARKVWEECITLCRDIGETWALARTLNILAMMVLTQGDYTQAMHLFQEAAAIAQTMGDRAIRSQVLALLAEVVRRQDEEYATRLIQEGLGIAREIGHQEYLSLFHYLIGDMARRRGNRKQALEHLRESLLYAPKGVSENVPIGRCLIGLARLASTDGYMLEAVRLWSAAEQWLQVNLHVHPLERTEYEHDLAALRDQLGEQAFAAAWNEGHGMTLEQALTLQASISLLLQHDASLWM